MHKNTLCEYHWLFKSCGDSSISLQQCITQKWLIAKLNIFILKWTKGHEPHKNPPLNDTKASDQVKDDRTTHNNPEKDY